MGNNKPETSNNRLGIFSLSRTYYHKNHNNKDYLSFCIVKTIFTNDLTKHYVFVEDLGRNK